MNILERILLLPKTGSRTFILISYGLSTIGSSLIITQAADVFLRKRSMITNNQLEQTNASSKPLRYLMHHAIRVTSSDPRADYIPAPILLGIKIGKLAWPVIDHIRRDNRTITEHPKLIYTWAQPHKIIHSDRDFKQTYAQNNQRFSNDACYLAVYLDEKVIDHFSLFLLTVRYITLYYVLAYVIKNFLVDRFMGYYLKGISKPKKARVKKTRRKRVTPYDPS